MPKSRGDGASVDTRQRPCLQDAFTRLPARPADQLDDLILDVSFAAYPEPVVRSRPAEGPCLTILDPRHGGR